MESVDLEDDVRWRESWVMWERTGKLALLAGQIFFTSYATLVASIQIVIFGGLSYWLIKDLLAFKDQEQPTVRVCSVWNLADAKLMCYVMCTWASVIAFCASFLAEPQDTWTPFFVMISGVAVICIGCAVHLFKHPLIDPVESASDCPSESSYSMLDHGVQGRAALEVAETH